MSDTNNKSLSLGCPLLVKELTELAARRRTYYIRVIYAVLLFASALIAFWANVYWRVQTSGTNLAFLGRGGDMFQILVALQFMGIYLFLPAMTCTAITAEKERDSLSLLLLTKLGPWTILFEKLVSRLIPMFTFFLLALPLMAFAYTFGGIEQVQIWGAIVVLGITGFQIAALCMMCSTYFRTTMGAFVASYVIGAVMLLLPIFVHETVIRIGEDIALMFLGPFVYFECFFYGSGSPWSDLSIRAIPLIGSSLVFLGMARYFLIRRAFAQPRHLLRRMFKSLDGIFSTLNENRLTRGVVLVRDRTTLPKDQPVAWRETEKKNLEQFRYLLRIFMGLEVPLMLICVAVIATHRSGSQLDEMNGALFGLWILAALMISVQASSLINGERSRQTLDVLLTTPLSGRDILLQKVQGLRRLMWVLSVCFLTIFLFEVWWYHTVGLSRGSYSPVRYFTGSLLSLLVYLPLTVWLSLWISLKAKTQTRAIIISILVLSLWCILPFAIGIITAEILHLGRGLIALMCFGPMGMILLNEFNHFPGMGNTPQSQGNYIWMLVLVNYAFYGFLVWRIRARCLHHADRYLGRREDFSGNVPSPTARVEPMVVGAGTPE